MVKNAGVDSGLPSSIGQENRVVKYETLEEASVAARILGITGWKSYNSLYKLDKKLPAAPHQKYRKAWRGWAEFLRVEKAVEKYESLSEASLAAIALGINSSTKYRKDYQKDQRLPSCPELTYSQEWISWPNFFGKKKRAAKYKELAEAAVAARRLRIMTFTEYGKRYSEDPKLPKYPETVYKKEWRGYYDFLDVEPPIKSYSTLAEASCAARALGFKSSLDYKNGRHQDPRLPKNPARTYKSKWENWYVFLGSSVLNNKYPSIEEAGAAARKLGVFSSFEYAARYKEDPRLPATPNKQYEGNWIDFQRFLLPDKYGSLGDVKYAIKVLKIKNSREYRDVYKGYPPLPAHPERVFASEWIDWYELCDVVRHYDYSQASKVAIENGIANQAAYINFIKETGDVRLPRTPDEVYKEVWINWHVFLGKEEPFTIKYIRKPYCEWAESIRSFMKKARGGESKESYLCRFVRQYVQKYELGYSPEAFLTAQGVSLKPFKELLEQQASDVIKRGILVAVNEFLNDVLRKKLSIEDEETGELVVIEGANNPLANFSVDIERKSSGLDESNKPALAYQYVDSLRRWIIPEGASSFSDLQHLHAFEADWAEIDAELIDDKDPDCIIKKEFGKTKIWFPVYWIHTYALTSVPARGRQIAYNDSGEGDVDVAEIEGGRIVWKKNTSPLAGSTQRQGFIKRYPDDQLGMWFTTNKTSNQGAGYSVPWIPHELAYWLTRLRCWQQKYNPISRPMPWLECVRTKLNETQRKNKGVNCFLFRDFGYEEPGNFTARLTDRLAAALYYSQPKGICLAELNGNSQHLSNYVSRYTPHSMRVSLITAYIVEFGLPIEVVMKIAGHSSIVMSIYYVKIAPAGLRHRFSEGEKIALKDKAYAAQWMIEQGRIDAVKSELISNSVQALNQLDGGLPAGSFLFRDYGFCPFAGTRCDDGGCAIDSKKYLPTPSGYMGSQNCIRCRHFVTGPAFMGGLLSLGNEISLSANHQFRHYDEIESGVRGVLEKINIMDEEEYLALKEGRRFDEGARNQLEAKLRKLRSESEAAAKKLDVLMCDIQSCAKLIKQCHALANEKCEGEDGEQRAQLIVQSGHELVFDVAETSYFYQLSEVCENAEIYESASADAAVMPRTQIIDRMVALNDLKHRLFYLDRRQQLVVGNQFTRLLLDRLKSWDRVDALMSGRILIKDLLGAEKITRRDLDSIFNSRVKSIGLEVVDGS